METGSRKAWVLNSAGETRIYRGNDGYKDDIATSYDYDGFVTKQKRIRSGDVVVLRTGSLIVGVGLIEGIEEWQGHRNFNRCPVCDSSKINSRTHKSPEYRCNRCHKEFDEPRVEERTCSKYRAHYGGAFTRENRPIPPQSMYVNRATQQAMRELHMTEAENVLAAWGIELPVHIATPTDDDRSSTPVAPETDIDFGLSLVSDPGSTPPGSRLVPSGKIIPGTEFLHHPTVIPDQQTRFCDFFIACGDWSREAGLPGAHKRNSLA